MRMKQEIDKTFDCQDGMKRSQQAPEFWDSLWKS